MRLPIGPSFFCAIASATLLANIGCPVADRSGPRPAPVSTPTIATSGIADGAEGNAPPAVTAPRSGFKLALTPRKRQHLASEPVELTVALRNQTRRQLPFGSVYRLEDFDFIVEDVKGRRMPLTRYGQQLLEMRALIFEANMQAIDPGKEVPLEVDINRVCDMTRVGTYRVKAQLMVPTHDPRTGEAIGSDTIDSNVVEVEILHGP